LFPLADERVPEALRRLRLNNHLQGKCPGSGYDDAGLRVLEATGEGRYGSKRQRKIEKIRKAYANDKTKMNAKIDKLQGGYKQGFKTKQAKLQDEGYCPLSTVIPKKFRARSRVLPTSTRS
jgi:hypothetical protein